MLLQGNDCWQSCLGSNKGILTSTGWKMIATNEKNPSKQNKTWSILLLPCGTAFKPDVNSFSAKVIAHSCTTLSYSLFHWKYAYIYVLLHFYHHLPFISPIIPTECFSCFWKASTLLNCWLLSFGCSFVIILPHRYIPSNSPTAVFFPSSTLKALYNHLKTIFFPLIFFSGLGRNLTVYISALLSWFMILSHSVTGRKMENEKWENVT